MISIKIQKIKKHFYDLMLVSSCHGLPCAFRSERIIFKLFWSIMFLCSTVVCIFLCLQNIFDFLEHSFVTHVDVVNEIPIQFPTVTFQNLNDKNYSLDDILINCYFNDDICSSDDFEISSNLYKFNSGVNRSGGSIPIKYTQQPGKDAGLQLELFVGHLVSDSLPKNRYNRFSGIHVAVHNYTVSPRNYDGFEISTGFATSLVINKVVSSKLPIPFNNCYGDLKSLDAFDSVLYKYIINSSKYIYRQKDCMDLCLSQEIIKNCNRSFELDYLDNLYYKYPSNEQCFNSVWKNLFEQDVYKLCAKYCPLECNSISYQLFTSFSQFPNSEYTNELMKNSKIISKFPIDYNVTRNDIEKSVLALNVYYEDLKYTQFNQMEEISVLELIANLGGILGLFLGISFLSFGEIIEFIFEIILVLLENDKQKDTV